MTDTISVEYVTVDTDSATPSLIAALIPLEE